LQHKGNFVAAPSQDRSYAVADDLLACPDKNTLASPGDFSILSEVDEHQQISRKFADASGAPIELFESFRKHCIARHTLVQFRYGANASRNQRVPIDRAGSRGSAPKLGH
jgi:hypothetical protein